MPEIAALVAVVAIIGACWLVWSFAVNRAGSARRQLKEAQRQCRIYERALVKIAGNTVGDPSTEADLALSEVDRMRELDE